MLLQVAQPDSGHGGSLYSHSHDSLCGNEKISEFKNQTSEECDELHKAFIWKIIFVLKHNLYNYVVDLRSSSSVKNFKFENKYFWIEHSFQLLKRHIQVACMQGDVREQNYHRLLYKVRVQSIIINTAPLLDMLASLTNCLQYMSLST